MVAAQSIQSLAEQLFVAFENGTTIDSPSETYPDMTIEDAYNVQRALIVHHQAKGRKIVGKKVGLTNKDVQRASGVYEPDYGALFDAFTLENGTVLSHRGQRLIVPRIEVELGFVLKKDIKGPGVTSMQLLGCIEAVFPVFEIIDSRIHNRQRHIVNTIADNSSSWGVIPGNQAVSPLGIDLSTVGMVIEQDGEIVRTGVGAAVLGHPLKSAAWLVNKLGTYDETLHAGDLLLTGSLSTFIDAVPGTFRARFSDGIGYVEFTMTE